MSDGLTDNTTQMVIDDDGWFDIGSDHNLLFWESVCSFGKNGRGEWEKKRLHVDARRIFGPGKQKGKSTGSRTRKKWRGKWNCLGLIC